MNTTNITKGKWILRFEESEKFGNHHTIHSNLSSAGAFIKTMDNSLIPTQEAEANAKLIIDAGNTANETGLLPSEIWAERKHFASLSIKMSDRIVDLENQKEGMLLALKQAQETMRYSCDKNKAGDGSTNGRAMQLVDDIIKQVTE